MKQLLHEYAGVLAVRQARLVLAAGTLSLLGDVVAMVALLLQVHDAGHGPYAVMALLMCFALPVVLTMGIAGSVADAHDPRRVLVAATTVQLLGAIGLVVAPSLVWTCLAALVMQTGFAFANPVWTAVMPLVVGEELAGTYVSLAQGLRGIASPIGAALAGVVVEHWGSRTALSFNAISLLGLVGAAIVLRVERPSREGPSHERPSHDRPNLESPRSERPHTSSIIPREGLSVLRRDRVLATLVLGVIPVILTVEAVNAVEVFLVRGELGATPTEYGLAEAAAGVGAVLGSFAAAALRTRRARINALLVGIAIVPACQVVQGLSLSVAMYAVSAFAVGLTLGVVNATIFALLLREVGGSDRGKVLALVSGLSRTATIGALALGGVLGTQVGARTAYVICGVVGLLIAGVAALRVHRSVDPVSTRRSVPWTR